MNTPKLFCEKDVLPLLNEACIQLENDFQHHKHQLKEDIIKTFQQAFITLKDLQEAIKKESQEPFKVGYIIGTLLRTKIINHNYQYTIFAYDKNWYVQEGKVIGEIDVSFFYHHFEIMWKQLLKDYKKYMGQLSAIEVEKVMLSCLDYFHKYVVEIIRFSLMDIVELLEYEAIEKEDKLEIHCGEYLEPCDIIYIEQQKKDVTKIKQWLEKNEREAYCFQDFRAIDFANEIYKNTDLRYTDFRDSNLGGSNLSVSLLMGAKFKRCCMKGSNLSISMIHDANFEKADLTEADLSYCVSFTGKNEANKWKSTGFMGTSFKESLLVRTDFTRATLMHVNFLGADLTEANFTEAVLYHSKFSKAQLSQTYLTQEQLQQIEVVDE
ncbi:MAG: pentapeptide repeat-containing protein [Cellulosilyticaceae bacterium]